MRITIFTEEIRDKLADKESAAYPDGGMNAFLCSFLSKKGAGFQGAEPLGGTHKEDVFS